MGQKILPFVLRLGFKQENGQNIGECQFLRITTGTLQMCVESMSSICQHEIQPPLTSNWIITALLLEDTHPQ